MASLNSIMLSLCNDLGIEIYQGEPPLLIWQACENLYHSSFCSASHLKAYASVDQSTYFWVSKKLAVIDAVLIYTIKKNTVIVINELVAVSSDHINQFSTYIFKQYRAVKIIKFKALYQENRQLHFPHQDFVFSEDFILELPQSADIWLAKLSKKMRATLRYLSSRSRRSEPRLAFRCIDAKHITSTLVQHILLLNRLRMEKKGKKFGISTQEAQYLIKEMRERGVIYVLEIDGKIIAGLLCTFCDKDLFFHVIAHDLAFDSLRAGLLCCYQSIVSAIENKYARIHFLWGRYPYKQQLGAQEIKLIKLTIFAKTYYQLIFPSCYLQKIVQQLRHYLKEKIITLLRSKFLSLAKHSS